MSGSEFVSVPVGTPDAAEDTRPLKELEATIRAGLRTFMEVGKALASIRERRLYREKGYGTFEEYCRREWGWTRRHVNQTIRSAAAVEEMGTIVPKPESESQARPLARIEDPAERAEVWQETVKEAEAEGAPITARRVEEKVRERTSPVPELPPFELSAERKAYYGVSRYFLGLSRLDPEAVAAECKTPKAAQEDLREAEKVVRWFGRYREALEARKRATGELRRIK